MVSQNHSHLKTHTSEKTETNDNTYSFDYTNTLRRYNFHRYFIQVPHFCSTLTWVDLINSANEICLRRSGLVIAVARSSLVASGRWSAPSMTVHLTSWLKGREDLLSPRVVPSFMTVQLLYYRPWKAARRQTMRESPSLQQPSTDRSPVIALHLQRTALVTTTVPLIPKSLLNQRPIYIYIYIYITPLASSVSATCIKRNRRGK